MWPKLPDAVGSVALHLHTANPDYYASPPPGNDAWITILGTLGRKWSDISWVGGTTDTPDGANPKIDVIATQVRDVDRGGA